MKAFIRNTLIIVVLIGIIYVYFKEYKPKIERYNKLQTEEQGIINELNAMKIKMDSLSGKKEDNMAKYTYESIQKELKTDSIRTWKTKEGLKFEVNEGRIFERRKSVPTKEGAKILDKLLGNISNVGGNVSIEVLIDSFNRSAKLKIERGTYIMKRMIDKQGMNRNNIQIKIIMVQKGLSGIDIELK